jgi:alpha-galactosidase
MFTPKTLRVLLVLATASAVSADGLNTPHLGTTPNGFTAPPRGWNSFALQSLSPSFTLNQDNVMTQCDAMADKLGKYGYEYCSLDSGWSVGDQGDEYGRIQYDQSIFDIPSLATHLHSKNLKLGVYVLPGYFYKDGSKQIYGTNPPITLTEAGDGTCNGLARCAFNYKSKGAQEYCNSVVDQFASW